jgi:hypothetical protein
MRWPAYGEPWPGTGQSFRSTVMPRGRPVLARLDLAYAGSARGEIAGVRQDGDGASDSAATTTPISANAAGVVSASVGRRAGGQARQLPAGVTGALCVCLRTINMAISMDCS